MLVKKFEAAVAGRFGEDQAAAIIAACEDQKALEKMSVPDFVDLWAAD